MTDFIGGICVGISQTAVGHPFDTVKVLMQNKLPWFGIPGRDYYRGWKFPLVSSILFNMTVFPMYERTLSYTNNSFISGLLAGVCVTPCVYILDVGKIKLQTKQSLSITYTKGFGATFARETLAMSTYFGMYDYFRRKQSPIVAGGLAGLLNWTLTYPIDVIRSRQIAQNITIKAAIAQRNLWRGYSVCAIRALIVNGISFTIYEKVRS